MSAGEYPKVVIARDKARRRVKVGGLAHPQHVWVDESEESAGWLDFDKAPDLPEHPAPLAPDCRIEPIFHRWEERIVGWHHTERDHPQPWMKRIGNTGGTGKPSPLAITEHVCVVCGATSKSGPGPLPPDYLLRAFKHGVDRREGR